MKIRNRNILEAPANPIVWVVAGSDSSAGAGIQADNQVCQSFGVTSRNIITALTAQNSQGVRDIQASSIEFFEQQFKTLQLEEVPQVIKLGMLARHELLESLLDILTTMNVTVVCDPVMHASAGGMLIDKYESYLELLNHVSILTPNQEEFSALTGKSFTSENELLKQVKAFSDKHKLDLVITGGDNHFDDSLCSDLCVIDGKAFWMHSPRKKSRHSHGTGCSFSSAIASALAMGYAREEAVVLAKAYLNQGFQSEENETVSMPAFQHTSFPVHADALPIISDTLSSTETYIYPREDTMSLGLYPVVDSLEWIKRCLEAGIRTLQLRIKQTEPRQLDAVIEEAVKLGRQYNARLFINDYWEQAIRHRAYGVHLGQEDLDAADLKAIAEAGLHLGVSTHNWLELARAHSICPSYIAIGPVYATLTKEMPFVPQGLQQLQQWVDLLKQEYPIVAIGGIDLNNASDVLETGVGSIAVVRAVTEADDYRQAIDSLQALINGGCFQKQKTL